MPDDLRNAVIDAAQRYFDSLPKKEFVAGKTYIPPTAKLVDFSDLSHLLDASLDMWWTAGRYAERFERDLADWMGHRINALAVNSGSSANLLALTAWTSPLLEKAGVRPLQPGDEVITAAAAFPTTVNPIVQNSGVPVFVDIDPATLNVTPEMVEAAVGPRTRGVILAHTLGNPFHAGQVADICSKYNLLFVEDCSDAMGAKVVHDGVSKTVGQFGDCASLSFYAAHHMTTGEGGAVLCRTPLLRKIVESLRDWGRDCWCPTGRDNTCGKRFDWSFNELPAGYDHKYVYTHLGFNLKITEMQAALGVSQLGKLVRHVEIRNRNWNALYQGVLDSPVLKEYLIPISPTPNTFPSWFAFPVYCQEGLDRRKLINHLENSGIGTRVLFAGNILRQPAYRSVNYRVEGALSATDNAMARCFWMGVHPQIGEAQINYMLEQLEMGVKAQLKI